MGEVSDDTASIERVRSPGRPRRRPVKVSATGSDRHHELRSARKTWRVKFWRHDRIAERDGSQARPDEPEIEIGDGTPADAREGQQDLPGGLGLGGRHAVPVDQDRGVTLRGHTQRPGRVLARGDRRTSGRSGASSITSSTSCPRCWRQLVCKRPPWWMAFASSAWMASAWCTASTTRVPRGGARPSISSSWGTAPSTTTAGSPAPRPRCRPGRWKAPKATWPAATSGSCTRSRATTARDATWQRSTRRSSRSSSGCSGRRPSTTACSRWTIAAARHARDGVV